MIRHAESEANIATDNYVNENNILYDWEHLSSNKTYLETIKYSHHLLDPSITSKGRLQVHKYLSFSAKLPKINLKVIVQTSFWFHLSTELFLLVHLSSQILNVRSLSNL